jgi:DNA processing protein
MQEHILQDWLTLAHMPGLGCTLINRLVEEAGTPGDVLAAGPARLEKIDGVGRKLARRLADRSVIDQARDLAGRELLRLTSLGISLVTPDDHRYPPLLKNIADPPPLLYCKGKVEYLTSRAVAVVGSRAATTYGRRISFELGRALAQHDIAVVSGMAMGIDGEAHAGALAGGGITTGVLGCGVDVVYPKQNVNLFREVEAKGLLVSEYPLQTPPDAFRFPERNRIISGLVLGVVIVEATLKSGSLITARLALEQGREVFAVPGRIDSVKSQGPHRLLQQGARLVHGVEDILEEIHLSGMMTMTRGPNDAREEKAEDRTDMSGDEYHLLSCLDAYPLNIDELAHSSGFDPATLADLLLRLELRGLVRQLPGQQYELKQ